MSRAVLSLGSNQGDRAGYLRAALEQLAPWTVAVSPWYVTTPWGPVAQDDFLNLVAVVDDPAASANDWLERAHDCERAAERTREQRWGPRSLDVDVIAVRDGDTEVVREDPELTLPHPRAHERAFVLVPWADVEPDAAVPGRGDVAGLLAALPADERAGVYRWDGSDPGSPPIGHHHRNGEGGPR